MDMGVTQMLTPTPDITYPVNLGAAQHPAVQTITFWEPVPAQLRGSSHQLPDMIIPCLSSPHEALQRMQSLWGGLMGFSTRLCNSGLCLSAGAKAETQQIKLPLFKLYEG